MKPSNFKSRLFVSSALLAAAILAICFGITILRKYSSKSYVLSKSTQNILKEKEEASKTRTLIASSEQNIAELAKHNITRQEEVPLIVENLESYADSLGLPLTINTINVGADQKAKTSTKEDAATKDAPLARKQTKELTIELTSNGSFGNLLKLIKLFENGDYILKIPQFSLKQVIMSDPGAFGGAPVFLDISPSNINPIGNKTWLLRAKLTILTNIK